ncbi:hypothetical protein HS7_20660 [Sulfolobales archaeon HS-7]|nr:hypothetical protein HS7_20660 [Sulfolobales archaeon HS-7]
MEKIEVEFNPAQGDKLIFLNNNIVSKLTVYYQDRDKLKDNRLIIVAEVSDEKEKEAVDFFIKESGLQGTVIVIKRV